MRELLECEIAYSQSTCDTFEDSRLIRFRDDLIPDMYDHNYTYIRPAFANCEKEMPELIRQEIDICRAEGKNYCQIRFALTTDALLPADRLQMTPERTRLGFYCTDAPESLVLRTNPACSVRQIEDASMVQERIALEASAYGESYGTDFCRRKGERLRAAYLSPTGANSYIGYVNGVPIGKCDLFVHEGIAKIEDFDVDAAHQRKGYGSALIKKLVDDAIALGAHCVYLVTDEGDSAKEMYEKIGFKKTGELLQLFFKW